MTRRYGDPVEVRRGLVDGLEAPEQFLWRGRLHVVRSVLAAWVETGPWWRTAAARPVYGLDTGPGPDAGAAAGPEGGDGPVAVLDDPGREVWRVEAVAGRHASPVVVDLALDEADGRWRLLRVQD